MFEGKLSLNRVKNKWRGELTFSDSVAIFTFESLTTDGDVTTLTFGAHGPATPHDTAELVLRRDDERLRGQMRWGPITWTPVNGNRWVRRSIRETAVHAERLVWQNHGR
jgi:hypothetical protein